MSLRERGTPRNHPRYRVTEHEADTGLIIYGRHYEDLFVNGAYALFSLVFDLRKIRRTEIRRFSVPEGDDALIVFLNELLYLFDVHRFIPKKTAVAKDGAGLDVLVEGERFDPERHFARKEIKAATYHAFSIGNGKNGLEAKIILDI
jgi:SHS2 domain-containing protein